MQPFLVYMPRTSQGPDRDLLRRVFGLTIVELRRAQGMAQETVALESGIDRGYMGGLERGRHVPTLDTIYKLLPVFRISFAEFAEHFEAGLRRAKRQASRNH